MTTSVTSPPWLARACGQLGLFETPGGAIDPAVKDMFADIGHSEVDGGDIAWCAAFAGSCLERSGCPSTKSLAARSYLAWGQSLDSPRPGSIIVLSRDPDPAQGHVGFYVGETGASVLLLGGNQSNGVTVSAFAKSRVLGMRWPVVGPSMEPDQSHVREDAAPVTPASCDPSSGPTSSIFNAALVHVLEMEGGYTDDPADPGGPTNLGITLADYAQSLHQSLDDTTRDALLAGLKRITAPAVRDIYWQTYWLPSGCPSMPAAIAYFHFDTAVNMGTGTAIRMLQTACGCLVDGEVGPITSAAVDAADPAALLHNYADLRRRRYRSLSTFQHFGRGWLARVDTTLTRALAVVSTPNLQQGKTNMANDQSSQNGSNDQGFDSAKWWGNSTTIWGAVITGLAAVVPALAPAIGVQITPDTIHTGADQIGAIIQALMGLAGTIAAINGRVNASQKLMQRLVSVKI